MIDVNTKIEDIVKLDNEMIKFFIDKKIDYCCNGYKTIKEVAVEKNLDSSSFLNMIAEEIKPRENKEETEVDLEDFEKLTVEEMIDSILIEHHQKERDLLFEIDPLLNKILSVHYDSHGKELSQIHSLFADLKMELEIHFIKEEKITFPLIL